MSSVLGSGVGGSAAPSRSRAAAQRNGTARRVARNKPGAFCPFLAELIAHAVWLYHCFSLSLRAVELILAQRGTKRFFKKLLKGLQYVPRVIVTDKLRSYGAAKRKILPGVEHRQSRYQVSHQPTRRRERQMQRFKSARHAQRFLSSHGQIHNLFQLRRHLLTAPEHRAARDRAFQTWRDVAGVARAA